METVSIAQAGSPAVQTVGGRAGALAVDADGADDRTRNRMPQVRRHRRRDDDNRDARSRCRRRGAFAAWLSRCPPNAERRRSVGLGQIHVKAQDYAGGLRAGKRASAWQVDALAGVS
jgi:hypothetical protein